MFEIRFETSNAAFLAGDEQDQPDPFEVGRILRKLAAEVESAGPGGGSVFDLNGNRVGWWAWKA